MLNTKRTKNLCAAVALAAAVATAHAGSGPSLGGATEITQLANKVELISTAASTAKTVTNTLQTVMNLQQALRSMDPAVLAQMMGLDVQGLDQLVKLYSATNDLQQSYEQTARMLDGFRNLSIQTNISPRDLLNAYAQAARQKGGVYRSAYNADLAALQQAQARAAAFAQQAKQTQILAANPNLAANLNNLAAINQRTSVILQDLTASVERANALAAQSKAQEQDGISAFNQQQQADLDRFAQQQSAAQVDWSLPRREDLLNQMAK